MRRWIVRLLPVLILAVGLAVSITLIKTAPKAERKQPPRPIPVVEVVDIVASEYQIKARSQGVVAPRVQSSLVSQVAGRVIEVGSGFRTGGFFESGDMLVGIDPVDYQTSVTVTAAEIARGELQLEEELARAEQAREEWATVRANQTATDLHLRKPQVASARAVLAAARAQFRQARLNLSRTRIVAPFAGRVLQHRVDVGQYVTPGTPLATIYAIDFAEVRLPLTDSQQAYLSLPERYRGEEITSSGPDVVISAEIGRQSYSWSGKVVRTEGEVDQQSRQLFVVAEIADPYKRQGDRPPLRVGQFVQAEIMGETLRGVYAVPRRAVRNGKEVLVVADDGKLYRRQLGIVWRDDNYFIANSGLNPGDRISVTTVPFAVDGSAVTIAGAERAANSKQLGAR